MLKKIFIIFTLFIFGFFSSVNYIFSAAEAPIINCVGLPGCTDKDTNNLKGPNISKNIGSELITNITSQVIRFVAVIAVIALIISGIMYMLSGGEEENTKRSKSWIIWSLVGVFLSVSALGIIQILNKLTIG